LLGNFWSKNSFRGTHKVLRKGGDKVEEGWARASKFQKRIRKRKKPNEGWRKSKNPCSSAFLRSETKRRRPRVARGKKQRRQGRVPLLRDREDSCKRRLLKDVKRGKKKTSGRR